MKFAAIILAYKEPEQVNVLIKQLLFEFGLDIDIFIHVSAGNESIINSLFLTEQVTVFPEHLGVKLDETNKKAIGLWATDGLLNRLLYTFEYSVNHSDADYYLVLSGQDMLVNKGLKNYLLHNSDKIFIDGRINDKKQRARLLYKWGPIFKTKYNSKLHPFRLLRRALLTLYSTGIKINMQRNYHLLDGYTICKNFYWMNLPVECVRYCIDYAKNNPKIMDIFKNSICPEESYFSTVLFNNGFGDRFNWRNKTEYNSLTFFGKFTTSFPMLENKDICLIDNSGCFLAKKFSLSYNKSIVEYYEKKTKGSD